MAETHHSQCCRCCRRPELGPEILRRCSEKSCTAFKLRRSVAPLGPFQQRAGTPPAFTKPRMDEDEGAIKTSDGVKKEQSEPSLRQGILAKQIEKVSRLEVETKIMGWTWMKTFCRSEQKIRTTSPARTTSSRFASPFLDQPGMPFAEERLPHIVANSSLCERHLWLIQNRCIFPPNGKTPGYGQHDLKADRSCCCIDLYPIRKDGSVGRSQQGEI